MDVTRSGRGVDLHFHLLPGLDDGPATLGESLDLVRAAHEDGTATIVATPHVRGDFVTDVLALPERVRELQAALDAERIPVGVRCGGELGHDMVGRLSQQELEAIAQGPPGARWLLVEAPFESIGEEFHAATTELRGRGFGVVIAHPERSADASHDASTGLRRELREGSLAQLNALSLSGGHGAEAERAAFRLVDEGMAAIVGSDAHGPTRPPALVKALRSLLGAGVDAAVARSLTASGPRRLLGRGIPRLPAPPRPALAA
jgi:protein-tyrosine phosphatase